MKGIKVLKSGFFSIFQDEGRLGYQDIGINISGAMDYRNYKLASMLVGDSDSVLEMTLMGSELLFLKNMKIAITGADMNPYINDKKVNMYRTLRVKEGDILSFKGLKEGFRTYISFSDDVVLDEFYFSKSTYTRLKKGGYKGRKLLEGDIIEVDDRAFEGILYAKKMPYDNQIRVIKGLEADQFEDADSLFSTYTLTNNVDRMGIKLEGSRLIAPSYDIISSPIIPGMIQVSPDGMPIIMLKDAQTVGGYTRIGTVISTDLDKLAQLRPSDELQFIEVDYKEAVKIKKEYLNTIKIYPLSDYIFTINHQSYDISISEVD